jgi:DNA invertase Pin-like site-specific DNA recombinase
MSEEPTTLRAIGYIWVPTTEGKMTAIEAQAERLRRHCRTQGWTLVAYRRAVRQPELLELLAQVIEAEGQRVVMTPETLAVLESRYADAWRGVRTRLETRAVLVVTGADPVTPKG